MKNSLRPVLIFIILTPHLGAVGVPAWFPATRGQLATKAEELAEVDSKLAEMDRRLVEADRRLTRVLDLEEKFQPHTGALRMLNQMNENEVKELLELTRSRYDTYSNERRNLSESSFMDFLGPLAGGLMGDPTSLMAMLAGMLGLGGAGVAARSNKKKKQAEEREAETRKKAVSYAMMGNESIGKIKADPDFPEIT